MQDVQTLVNMIQKGRKDVDAATAGIWATYLQQLKGCHLFSVASPDVDKTAWLKERRAGIGGSEIATIMGENHWASPRQIWLSKIGMLDDKPAQQSESARWGQSTGDYCSY